MNSDARPTSCLRLCPSDRRSRRLPPRLRRNKRGRCDIYYSIDPDPRARFWRSTDIAHEGETFVAQLPLESLDAPLFAFANVYYTLPKPESLAQLPGYSKPIHELCLSTDLHRAAPAELRAAHVPASGQTSRLIDDFAHGWRDWYAINADHLPLWQHWTRKVTDPKWQGPDGAGLSLTLKSAQENELTFVVIENEWRDYRGPKKTFVCIKKIAGGSLPQTLTVALEDFHETQSGAALESWSQLNQLGLCGHYGGNEQPTWHGPLPEFLRLEWK